MGGKSNSSTIATEEPRLGNLRVQTSMYGLAQAMVWGQTRVTGNLLWFGNFQAIATTTTTSQGGGGGGKGGGGGGGGVTQVDTKYSYKAAAMLGIARGPILGIASAWKGKRRYYGYTVPVGSVMNSQYLTAAPGVSVAQVALPGPFGNTISLTVLGQTTGYDYGMGYG